MKSKKAQVMSFEMVFLTLFMMFLSITTYMVQKDTMDTTLISPTPILDSRLDSDILKIQEKDMLVSSAIELDWDDENFKQNAENSFFEQLEGRPEIIEKLFLDLDINDDFKEKLDTLETKMKHLKNVYSVNANENSITLTRDLTKRLYLRPESFKNIGFSTTAKIELDETIILSKEEIELYKINTEIPEGEILNNPSN